MAIIGEFGSAPDHQQQGYRGQGYVVHGTEEDVLKVFRASDVVLVKGAVLTGTAGQFEFYPMFRTLDIGEFSNVIGRFIATTRANAGLSTAELAKQAHVSEGYQKLIESGLTQPNKQYMQALSLIFGGDFKEKMTNALCS